LWPKSGGIGKKKKGDKKRKVNKTNMVKGGVWTDPGPFASPLGHGSDRAGFRGD